VVEEGQSNTGSKTTRKKSETNYSLSIDEIFSYINDTTKNLVLNNQYIGNRAGHAERVKMNVYTGETEIAVIHD